MANPNPKKAAPSYFVIKSSIMALSLACTLGGWGYLASTQLSEAKAKQAEQAQAEAADIQITELAKIPQQGGKSIAPVKLRKVVDIVQPKIEMVRVSASAPVNKATVRTQSVQKKSVTKTPTMAQVSPQIASAAQAAPLPVRRAPVTRTRSSR